MSKEILLESGTGELEVLEFIISGKHYVINIIKVKEVEECKGITPIPQASPEIGGLLLCRDEIITLVDLKYVLEGKKDLKENPTIIICEFNKLKVAFNIDSIVGVHRIKWQEIRKPSAMTPSNLVIGNIVMKDKILLLLDFEKIVTDINPNVGISTDRIVDIQYKDRSKSKILMADDSSLIRNLLKDTLNKAGFTNLKTFDDGKELLNYLEDLIEKMGPNYKENVDLIITDIEMPQMDGHTMTRKIKEHPMLKSIPVVIFSSLITDELKHKGDSVQADAQLSKPEVSELVKCVDNLLGL